MCFAIGQRIVENEHKGEKWVTYDEQVFELLARAMTAEFGRGFSKRNLELMRRFISCILQGLVNRKFRSR
jgi:hypothetical protein